MGVLGIVAAIIGVSATSASLGPPGLESIDWARADTMVVRLPPSAFPKLPPAVRAVLQRRGCTIPQSFQATAPENVVRGEFLKRGQQDWAVLCSCELVSRVLIIRGDTGAVVDSLAEEPDVGRLQVVAASQVGYSRVIATAPAKQVRVYLSQDGAPAIARGGTLHDGIFDVFLEKGAEVFYSDNGTWVTIAASD